jgi:hypothetical protein
MDFTSIEIEGLCFKEPKEFKLFIKKEQKAAIVYGRNGSGKKNKSTF